MNKVRRIAVEAIEKHANSGGYIHRAAREDIKFLLKVIREQEKALNELEDDLK